MPKKLGVRTRTLAQFESAQIELHKVLHTNGVVAVAPYDSMSGKHGSRAQESESTQYRRKYYQTTTKVNDWYALKEQVADGLLFFCLQIDYNSLYYI